MEDVRRRVVVSGRVQGVFFRDACQHVAREFGVRGWVRNRPDGVVEVVAEGSETEVERLVEWCRTGPPKARVTGIAVATEPPAGETAFTVRY